MSLSSDKTLETARTDNDDINKLRRAKEVFLFMHPTVRISRNIRALWFFDHLHKRIKIGPDEYEKSSQIEVVGIVPEDGIESPEEDGFFVITENTIVTYMSHLYRLVFILDMSPSTFVVESSGSVMQLRVIESLRRSLESVTRKFRYPGSSRVLRPKVYISICVFSPFIAVPGDHVLLQGVLLTSDNLEAVMATVKRKLDFFLTNLWTSANTQLCTWNAERRRMRSQQDGLASLVYNESATEYDSRGYVQPEWALVFMLRMGLLGVQMLPENTQSNIIVITDGVVGMPNAQALAQVLTQLRSFTVSCSFIQLTAPFTDDSVFGNFSSPELLNFLAMATFGTYIYDQNSIPTAGLLELNRFHRAFLCWSFQRALASNDFIFDLVQPINPEFAELSNRDSVKRVYKKNSHFTTLENLLYVRLREGYTVRRVKLDKVVCARRNSDDEVQVDRHKESTYIHVELRLPWKPLVFINYDIKLPWGSTSFSSKREIVQIEVSIEAPFHLLKDFLSVEKFSSEQRQNSVDALKSSMYSVMQADRLLLHIHKFNTDPEYYTIPGEVTEAFALFTLGSEQSIVVSKDMQMRNTKFVEFWYLVCGMDEGIWQKWVHTHTIRLILSPEEPLPKKLFTGKAQLSVRTSYTKLHDLLKSMTTFTLVQFQSYIKFVYEQENPKVPKYFYIVRTSQEGPCVILKIAFLGGIGAPDRKRVEEELKRQLTIMAVPQDQHYAPTNRFPEFSNSGHYGRRHSYSITKKDQLAVTIVTKPLERILIRYKGFPKSYGGIVRLEEESHAPNIREIVLHNSVAKYLVCRRRVWCIPRTFRKADVMSLEAAEYVLQVILQRHLSHGFKIAHAENGVITLCRQSARQTIEQFVIFPPSRVMTGYSNPGVPYPRPENEMFLITEMWTEPESTFEYDETASYRMSTELIEQDADLIAVLTTFDQLTRACETHFRSCVIFGISSCKERKPFEELNHSVAISHNSFDLCILLKNSTEKHLLLFPTMGFSDFDPKSRHRLSDLLNCLHCEMTSVSDICLDVKDGKAWYEMVEDLEYNFDDTESLESSRSTKGTQPGRLKANRSINEDIKMRIYISRISPWRLIVVVIIDGIDDILDVTSQKEPSIPVLVFHIDEPSMAKRIAINDKPTFVPWHVDDFRARKENILAMLNQQIQENKASYEDVIESCWFQQARNRDHNIFNTLFSFSAYCDIIEEKVFSRAYVASVFRNLTDEVYVPEEVFREAMEDRSDHTTIGIDGISKIQAAVCSHIDYMEESICATDDECLNESRFNKTCGKSLLNIDYLLQKYKFKPVPNVPTYFFYCPNVDREQDDTVLNTMCIEPIDLTSGSEGRSRTLSHVSNTSAVEDKSPSLVNESTNSENGCEDFAPCDEEIAETTPVTADDNVDDEEEEEDENVFEEEEDYESSNDSSFARELRYDTDSDSENRHGCIDTYWPNYLDVCPLFVQFSCTVKSLEGSIVNYPLTRLPYCLSECFGFDMGRSCDMLGSEITIDMYVLTWAAPLSTISEEYFEELQFRDYSNYNYNYNRSMYESQFSYRIDGDSLERSTYTKTGVMENLPDRERSIVLQLQAGLENLIESERLLFLGRLKKENATKGNINDVVQFVTSAKDSFLDDFIMLSPKCPPFVSILYKEYSCKFVIDWAEGITRLLRLLDGHVICANSYELQSLPRRRKEQRLYLFCDAVTSMNSPLAKKHTHYHRFFDYDRHDEWIVEQERQSSVNPLDEEYHHFNDFWLVVKAEKKRQMIGVYLCQRHSMVNDAAYDELRSLVKKCVRQTNQEVLLERLHRTLSCDSLLVRNGIPELSKEKGLSSLSSDDECDLPPDDLPELVEDRFRVFNDGHFACEMVWSHWFEIHPRLIAPRLPGESPTNTVNAPAALLALTIGLEQLAVRNRKNLFVFLDDAGNSYYLRLHTNRESYNETCSSSFASREWLQMNEVNFNTSILLSAYGVHEPNEQITVGIRDVLKKRLDQRVMEEIVYAFAKNFQAHLTIADVCFIQPEGSEPFNKVYFTVPTILNEFLGSYWFFLKQLLLTFSVTPRVREKSGSSRKSSVVTNATSSAFIPYLARSSKAEFSRIQDSSAFFLVVKPAASGSRNVGLALIDISFVGPDGNPKDLPPPPEMLLTKVPSIYPATGSRSRAGHISQELTKTRTVSALSEAKMSGVGAIVQCAIWQVGDVGLEELQEKVRVSVQQALCDVVTEYGLLSTFLCDVSHTPFSPSYRNGDAQRLSLDVLRHQSADHDQQHSLSLQQLPIPKRSSSGSASPSNPAQLQRASTTTMFPFNGAFHSQPTTNAPPSVCGDCENRLSDGEESDRVTYNGLQKASATKLHQKTSLDSIRRRPSGPAPMDCLKMNFVISMAEWFDHVVKELSKLTTVYKTVKKVEFNLDCDVAASKLVQVIYRELTKVIPQDKLTIYASHEGDNVKSDRRFQPVSPEDIATYEYQDLGRRVLTDVNETIDIILIGYEKMHYNLRELNSPHSVPDNVRVSQNKSTEAYQMHMPADKQNIPRQRLLYLINSGETLTLYMYNYLDEIVARVQRVVDTAVSWINARSWLLRGIGLQKMGIVHLNSINKSKDDPNPYMPLTWMNPQLLVECDYPKPHMINIKIRKNIPHEELQICFRTYRNSELSFAPRNLNENSVFYGQTSQMLTLRSEQLNNIQKRDYLANVHREMLTTNVSTMENEVFREFMARSRDVHYVKTPILLLKGWRIRIGEIRAAGKAVSYARRRPSIATSSTSAWSSCRKCSTPRGMDNEEDPAIYRIQYMLIKDYIEYLKSFGFKVVTIQKDVEKKTCCEILGEGVIFHPEVTVSPEFWMYLPLDCGIIFCNLFFFKPYFGVHFYVWSCRPETASTNDPAYADETSDEEDDSNDVADESETELESFKNLIISKSHVHSFTYDFHLRTIATYLMGKDEYGLFNNEFDAEGFLTDFLKYYEGRPPNARNCLYEDQLKYDKLEVSRKDISDYFLNEKLAVCRKEKWRTMRLRARSAPNSDAYMLISREEQDFSTETYGIVRVVILDRSHDHRESSPRNIMLKFYVILISADSVFPMIDVHPEQASSEIEGEFKQLPSFPEEDEDDYGTDDDLFSSKGDDLMTTSAYERTEYSQSHTPVRRRFCSGDTVLMNSRKKSNGMMRRRTSTDAETLRGDSDDIMTSSDSDLSSIARRQSKVDFLTDLSPSTSKVSIQRNPPRRHRKSFNRSDRDREKQSLVAREQVTYLHYISPRQHLLQGILEDATQNCKLALLKMVGEADWYCRRDKLWTSLFSSTSTLSRSMTTSIVPTGRLDLSGSAEPRPTVRQVTNTDMSSNDLEALMNMSAVNTLKDEIPDLCNVLNTADQDDLFKYTVDYFGDRCRFFDHSKKCLLIIDPNNVQTVAVLLRYDPKRDSLELLTMYKDCKDCDTVSDTYTESFKADECRLIHEVSTCLMSYIWSDLLHSPLLTASKLRANRSP